MNNQKPIWLRKSDDVTPEEYSSFYKSLTNDWNDHLKVTHFSTEGQIEYKALLYVPKTPPFDMFNKKTDKTGNVKLYVKRVFIMDNCEELMPEWLGFVSGIIDSNDLPLNVSREILQENKVTRMIKKNVVKKCIEMFTEMSNDSSEKGLDMYNTFYESYQKNVKLGIHEDQNNRPKLIKLLRFYSSKSGEKQLSLDEYVSKMKENQKGIYFITGENKKSLENSPFVNGLTKHGYDVLFMTDPIDEYMLQSVKDYDDKTFIDISKEGVELTENIIDETTMKDFESGVCAKMKEILADKVESIKVSKRLSDSPCCISSSKYGWSANMERIMKAQTLQSSNSMASYMSGKRVLELNIDHPMILHLQKQITDESINDKTLQDVTQLMYDTALVASGFTQDDPSDFSARIYRMIALGIDVDEVIETNETVQETCVPCNECCEEESLEEID